MKDTKRLVTRADRVMRAANSIETYKKVIEALEKVSNEQVTVESALKTYRQYLAVHERKYQEAQNDLCTSAT